MEQILSKDDVAEKMFLEGKSITQISKELKVDRGCLSIRLKKRGLNIVQHCNKKTINSNVFNEIDTEEKAYWLGFLMADGSVSDSNKIELSSKDKDHIEKYKSFLNSQHKISVKKALLNGKEFVSYRLNVQDKQIANDLKKYGCIPNKTFEMHLPNIEKQFMRHWLRGYFDGDGCIAIGKNKGTSYITLSSGNQYILEEICNFINQDLNMSPKIYVRRSNTCYEIRTFNIKNTEKLLNFMYDNITIYLNRKHEKFTHYCRLETKLQKSQDN